MGFATVNMIGPKTEQREPKEQKKDTMDYILEGLQIAQGITGIAVNYQTIKSKMGENTLAEDARNGIQTSKYGTEYATGKKEVPAGTENSVLLRTREKDDVIQEKSYITMPKEPGLRTPIMVDFQGPDGKWGKKAVLPKEGDFFASKPDDKKPLSGTWVETIGANGKPERRYVENVVGASVPTKELSGQNEGNKVVDREFAKDYNEWTSGSSEFARLEIKKLKGVTDDLRGGSVTTGGMTGMLPDAVTSSSLLKVRSDVESTVMNSLRAILGPAFTEKEGQRIIKSTWNEADSTENNIVRLDRVVSNLESQANAKDDKSNYFSENGTLKGWKAKGSGQATAGKEQGKSVYKPGTILDIGGKRFKVEQDGDTLTEIPSASGK